ncbi:MAG: hypothetical protein IJZ15_03375 [Oscillospiraceae bacterium]|nr:hypothetical protein [Oscillospiraceae bacterium]
MKKAVIWMMLICLMLSFSACGSSTQGEENKGHTLVPDISIDQIEWSVDSGTIKGENYVLGKVINNSPFVITSLKISFTEKQGISEADKASFYADIQKSQGFDDAWMTEYIESREKLSQPISMYFKIDDSIEIGAEQEQIKCYYMGGWTSKNVVYPDLFVPEIATIEYEKEGVQYTLYYNFISKNYDLEKAE